MNQQKDLQEQDLRIKENLDRIRNRIVVFSGKGGVGKSTVSVHLAHAFKQMNWRTGLLDADITGPNIPQMLGLAGQPEGADEHHMYPMEKDGLQVISIAPLIPKDQPVIWRGPLRSGVISQFLGDVVWGDLDVLVVDLPPGTGDEVLTASQKMIPQMAVIVTTPQEVSVLDCKRAVNMAKKLNIPHIGIIENMSGMVCPHCGEAIDLFDEGGGERMAKEMDVTFLGRVPINPDIRKGGDAGFSLLETDPDAAASRIFVKAAEQIRSILEA